MLSAIEQQPTPLLDVAACAAVMIRRNTSAWRVRDMSIRGVAHRPTKPALKLEKYTCVNLELPRYGSFTSRLWAHFVDVEADGSWPVLSVQIKIVNLVRHRREQLETVLTAS